MKEMSFDKRDSEFIIDALQSYRDSCRFGFLPQDTQVLKKINEVEKTCERLIKKFQNAQKKIKTSSAKAKGRNLQYWVCEQICKMFNIEFVQSDDTCPVHSREMGQHGTDICLRGDMYDKFPFDVECKCCESLSLPKWIEQAKTNTKNGRKWLLVIKKKSIGEPVVCIDWSTFEELLKNDKYLSL